MITRRGILVTTGGLAAVAAAQAAGAQDNKGQGVAGTALSQKRKGNMQITRSGTHPSQKGSAEYFTGSVRIDSRFQGTSPARVGGGIVTFEPSARTAWHTHPLGQTLIVVSGAGWIQVEGGKKEEVRPGDIVYRARVPHQST